jgi:hypothetical protein
MRPKLKKKTKETWKKGIDYIVIPELPKKEQKPFSRWLTGQTQPLVVEEGENQYKCAYVWDYNQWKAAWVKGKTAPVYD